jgi:hypothetical protein
LKDLRGYFEEGGGAFSMSDPSSMHTCKTSFSREELKMNELDVEVISEFSEKGENG